MSSTENKLHIGIDFGGVCSIHSKKYEAMPGENLSDNPAIIDVPNCTETLKALRSAGHKLYLLSFCGAKRAKETYDYLKPLDLFDGLYFIKNRKNKAFICRYLGLDVMIDDRTDVLNIIQKYTPTKTILFTLESDLHGVPVPNPYQFIPTFTAPDWNAVATIIPSIKSLNQAPDYSVHVTNFCFSGLVKEHYAFRDGTATANLFPF